MGAASCRVSLPALLRSGRVELWLEMKLPDVPARAAILRTHLNGLPEEYGAVDVERLAEETAEFTGAAVAALTGALGCTIAGVAGVLGMLAGTVAAGAPVLVAARR